MSGSQQEASVEVLLSGSQKGSGKKGAEAGAVGWCRTSRGRW